MAREISVLLGRPLEHRSWPVPELSEPTAEAVDVQVLDEALCPRYCGLVVRGVEVGAFAGMAADAPRSRRPAPDQQRRGRLELRSLRDGPADPPLRLREARRPQDRRPARPAGREPAAPRRPRRRTPARHARHRRRIPARGAGRRHGRRGDRGRRNNPRRLHRERRLRPRVDPADRPQARPVDRRFLPLRAGGRRRFRAGSRPHGRVTARRFRRPRDEGPRGRLSQAAQAQVRRPPRPPPRRASRRRRAGGVHDPDARGARLQGRGDPERRLARRRALVPGGHRPGSGPRRGNRPVLRV